MGWASSHARTNDAGCRTDAPDFVCDPTGIPNPKASDPTPSVPLPPSITSRHILASDRQKRRVSDGFLSVRIPSAWSYAIGPGTSQGQPAAYILVADFRIPTDAAMHEAPTPVPAGRVLISLGDFPLIGPSYKSWPQVTRLRLLRDRPSRRQVSWHVRFHGRAVTLAVRFGSTPSTKKRQAVNDVLATAAVQRG